MSIESNKRNKSTKQRSLENNVPSRETLRPVATLVLLVILMAPYLPKEFVSDFLFNVGRAEAASTYVDSGPEQLLDAEQFGLGIVTQTGNVNIREDHTTESSVVGQFAPNTLFLVDVSQVWPLEREGLAKTEVWYPVIGYDTTGVMTEGYIRGDLILVVEEDVVSPDQFEMLQLVDMRISPSAMRWLQSPENTPALQDILTGLELGFEFFGSMDVELETEPVIRVEYDENSPICGEAHPNRFTMNLAQCLRDDRTDEIQYAPGVLDIPPLHELIHMYQHSVEGSGRITRGSILVVEGYAHFLSYSLLDRPFRSIGELDEDLLRDLENNSAYFQPKIDVYAIATFSVGILVERTATEDDPYGWRAMQRYHENLGDLSMSPEEAFEDAFGLTTEEFYVEVLDRNEEILQQQDEVAQEEPELEPAETAETYFEAFVNALDSRDGTNEGGATADFFDTPTLVYSPESGEWFWCESSHVRVARSYVAPNAELVYQVECPTNEGSVTAFVLAETLEMRTAPTFEAEIVSQHDDWMYTVIDPADVFGRAQTIDPNTLMPNGLFMSAQYSQIMLGTVYEFQVGALTVETVSYSTIIPGSANEFEVEGYLRLDAFPDDFDPGEPIFDDQTLLNGRDEVEGEPEPDELLDSPPLQMNIFGG